MKRLLLACLVVVAASSASARQEPPLPAARDVIAKHVVAIGGEAAFKAITSITVRGRLEIAAQNLSGALEIFSARPNKMVTRVDVAGEGMIESGYDGKVGWSIDPQGGAMLLTGDHLIETIDDARFDGTLHPSDYMKSMTTIARTTFDKRDAYKVHVVFASGREQDEYFDVEHGWQIGWEGSRQTQMGLVPSASVLREYKKFGTLMQATTLVERALGFETVLKISSYEYNAVAPAAFDLPPAVKALIKK